MSSDSDIRMLAKVERSPYSNSWGGNIFYVIGKPVKMQYESHLNEHMPYGGFDPYAGDPYYEGLQVSSQGDLDTGNVYGHAVEYHDLTRLGLLDDMIRLPGGRIVRVDVTVDVNVVDESEVITDD